MALAANKESRSSRLGSRCAADPNGTAGMALSLTKPILPPLVVEDAINPQMDMIES